LNCIGLEKKRLYSHSHPFLIFTSFFSFLFWSFSLSFLLHDHSTNIAMLSMYHQGPMFIALYDLRYASDLPRPTLNRPRHQSGPRLLWHALFYDRYPPSFWQDIPPSHPRIDTSLLKGSALSFLLRIWPFSFSSPSSNLFLFFVFQHISSCMHILHCIFLHYFFVPFFISIFPFSSGSFVLAFFLINLLCISQLSNF